MTMNDSSRSKHDLPDSVTYYGEVSNELCRPTIIPDLTDLKTILNELGQ